MDSASGTFLGQELCGLGNWVGRGYLSLFQSATNHLYSARPNSNLSV